MTDANTLDTEAVSQWLSTHLDDFSGPLTAEKFAQGQSNPTYLLSKPQRVITCCAASPRGCCSSQRTP